MEEGASNNSEGKYEKSGVLKSEYPYRRELFYKTLLEVLNPKIVAYLERLYQVEELLSLSGIISVGENQLHHVIRMLEMAASCKTLFALSGSPQKSGLAVSFSISSSLFSLASRSKRNPQFLKFMFQLIQFSPVLTQHQNHLYFGRKRRSFSISAWIRAW
jgi:hypothetical protein